MAKIRKKRDVNRFRKIILIFSLFFILLTIPLIVLYVRDSSPKDSRSQAAEITVSSLNSQIDANLESGNTLANKFLLTQRQDQMEYLAAINPQLFLQYAYSPEYRNRFPEDQKSLVEEKTVVSGKILEGHRDNFEKNTKKNDYFIQNSERTYAIKTAEMLNEEEVESGREVKIDGYKIGGNIVAENSNVSISGEVALSSNSDNIGNYLVIPVNFVDDRSRPYSITEISNRLFENDNSVRNYFSTVTGGRHVFNGKILPWQETGIKKDRICDDPFKLIDFAYNKFNNAVNNSSGVIFIFPSLRNCDWIGLATLGGEPYFAWLSNFSRRTTAHEVAHNMNLDHASLMRCGQNGCNSEEYGDGSDILGYTLGNLNGPHRIGLGIMVADGVRVFSSNNTFTINKLGSKSTPQIIYINDPGSARDIYVEFRGANSLFSNNTPYLISEGVLIYRWDGKRDSRTFLMDITSGDGNPYNLALKDGQTVSIGPVKIKQISHDNNSAKIRIEKR